MTKEFNALLQNNTLTLIHRSSNMHIIGCKWIFRLKTTASGSIDVYKARLVAKGFTQHEGHEYLETFSLIVKMTTIRFLLAFAVSHDWNIHQLDVSNAFLHGDLHDIIYMEQPLGFTHPLHPNHICKLNKSLYGLKQAPRDWFKTLSTYLLSFGFTDSKIDTSLFFKNTCTELIFILIYVDDILVISPNLTSITSLLQSLHSKFAIRDLGAAKFFLGIELIPHSLGYLLSQQKYITNILEKTNMDKCKPLGTTWPLPNSSSQSNITDPFHNPTLHRSIFGSL